MGLLDKIKGLLGKNKKAVAGAVDKAADLAQKAAPASVDSKIEAGAEKVKDVIGKIDDK